MKSFYVYIKKVLTVFFLVFNIRKILNGHLSIKSSIVLFPIRIKGLDGNFFSMSNAYISKSSFLIKGYNNEISIKAGVYNTDFEITGSNNKILIESGVQLFNSKITINTDDAVVHIGKDSTIGSLSAVCMGKGNSISIGRNCMIAENVEIWNTDSHNIYDKQTSTLLNPAQPVKIGNNVWLGKKSTILKGVTIGDGCIIGMGAIVSKDVKPGCIVVGFDRVVRENVEWTHRWARL